MGGGGRRRRARRSWPWGRIVRKLFLPAVGLLAAFIAYICYDLPDISTLGDVKKKPSVIVKAEDGTILGTYGDTYGDYVPYSQIPRPVIDAVLATEDRNFFHHFGIDPWGLLRAMWVDLRSRHLVQGGSTITQQLAKNVFLTPDRKLKRKIQEMVLALELEHRYTKEQILTIYLNRVYMGAGSFGVDAASRRYFNHSVRQVTLNEAAILVGRIGYDRIVFHYPSRPDKPTIHGLNLNVQPGETLALVGPSGAGKTTLFQLLLRFYDPQEGRVTIDGVNIRNVKLTELRSHIGIVPQDPVIFSANAWDNIRCGKQDATAKEILLAAGNASALEFLEKLPDGLDTHLGEKGIRLSGGQKQRIAIARAMVRNPRILLLDEATSALDSENERKVQQVLATLMQGRTTLVIAHRLSTVQNASRIAVINEGRLEAIGKHEELLATNELYARLCELQFKTAA